jgi:hypothetical protein
MFPSVRILVVLVTTVQPEYVKKEILRGIHTMINT